jgi:hypothetical protein
MTMRNEMLITAVNAVRSENGALAVANVAVKIKELHPDVDLAIFDLRDDEEFSGAIAATNPASEAYDAEQRMVPALIEPSYVNDVFLKAPGDNTDLPSLQEIDQTVVNLRVGLRNLGDQLKIKRAKLAEAITAWQSNGKRITPNQLLRDNARHQHEMRVAAAAGNSFLTADVTPKANSYIDRSNGRGGSGDDFARYRMRNGGHRRGAFHPSQQGRRLKMPSEV